LEGQLLRAQFALNTTGHEGVLGAEVQEFGVVHIKNKKTISIFLSNLSQVPGRWKLHHVKIN
jgi:hypothetical protein